MHTGVARIFAAGVFITKAKDMSFMIKAKVTDFCCCPDVKAKVKDSFLENF